MSYQDNSGTLEILEENNYYPFGLKHKGYNFNINSTNIALKRKFGGKELQDDDVNGNKLDWYDFGARNYDAALGRWMNLDPLAETSRRFSPYTYALNNPVYFIDPDGMEAVASAGPQPLFLTYGNFDMAGSSFNGALINSNTLMGNSSGGSDPKKKDFESKVRPVSVIPEELPNGGGSVNNGIGTTDEKDGEVLPQESQLSGSWGSFGPWIYQWTKVHVNVSLGYGYWEFATIESNYFGGWGLGDIAGGEAIVIINPAYALEMQSNSLKDILNSAAEIRTHSGGIGFGSGARFVGTTNDGTIVYKIISQMGEQVSFNAGYSPPQTSSAPVFRGFSLTKKDSIKSAEANLKAQRGDIAKYAEYLRKNQH